MIDSSVDVWRTRVYGCRRRADISRTDRCYRRVQGQRIAVIGFREELPPRESNPGERFNLTSSYRSPLLPHLLRVIYNAALGN